ncbi:uncharacterized protein LOC142235273 [Haematobia irritans]|uniref:uncharacterized protein LOC142235273 n=1 Tax=Haematobia irritans TaxID=7368 RepID=UPI003F4FAB3B
MSSSSEKFLRTFAWMCFVCEKHMLDLADIETAACNIECMLVPLMPKVASISQKIKWQSCNIGTQHRWFPEQQLTASHHNEKLSKCQFLFVYLQIKYQSTETDMRHIEGFVCKLEREIVAATTKEVAFTRHQIEKRRLIELVKLNPILWDCRLPHYKRSDKKKALKWNELGRIFSVNGERVQRTFTSLREIFRRELNHEKMLGSRFKSKWEYYDEMAFLKEVIRERKSRERAKSNDGLTTSNINNNTTNSTVGIDEYQYFAPNDPNNPQNQIPVSLPQLTANPSTPLANIASQNLPPQNGSTTPQIPNNPPNTPVSTISGHQIPTDVILNLNPSTLAALQKLNANNNHSNLQPPPRPISRARSLTIRSGSSSPSIYIKDEPDSLDDTISLGTTSNGKIHKDYQRSLAKGKSQGPKLMAESKNLNNSTQNLVIDERDCSDIDDDPDVDMMDDDRLSISTSLVSLQKDPIGHSKNSQNHPTQLQQQQLLKPTAHEILYTKFGEFLAARLNTLSDTVANELMNKILMLIAEK